MGSIEWEQPAKQKSTPFNLTEVDLQILSQADEEFVYHDWEDLKGIIGKFIAISLQLTVSIFPAPKPLPPNLVKTQLYP
jgi:hypothetical protein